MELQNTGTWNNFAPIPAALTVAGSDSGGGAGIQADLRTFTACGVFGTSAPAALTAQNPAEVRNAAGVDPALVKAQIGTVFSLLNIRAVKTGMLFSAEIIEAAADALKQALDTARCPLVIDPVMISTSGMKLLRDDALDALKNTLLPLSDWLTPNIPEAEALSGIRINSPRAVVQAAEKLAAEWNTGVIVKGGHSEGDTEAADIVCSKDRSFRLVSPRLRLPPHASHGTGCTFSATLAASLAKGMDELHALVAAKAFVFGSLSEARSIGRSPAHPVFAMFPPSSLEKYRSRILVKTL